MNRVPVVSTNVVAVGYDLKSRTLEVEFKAGTVYQYFDVPEAEYRCLLGADSVGRYLNQNIKGSYRYVQI